MWEGGLSQNKLNVSSIFALTTPTVIGNQVSIMMPASSTRTNGRFLHSFKDHHKYKKMGLHMVKPCVKRVSCRSQRTFWNCLIWIYKLVIFQRLDCISYCFPCDTAFVSPLLECKGIHSKTLFWNSNWPDHVKGTCRFLCWTLNFFLGHKGSLYAV